MPSRLLRMLEGELAAVGGEDIEGYLSSLFLRQGFRYLPSAGTDLALVVDARSPRATDGPTDVVVTPDMSEGARNHLSRIGVHIYALRDLIVFELDWAACRSLMAQSHRFRGMFQSATSRRLSSLHFWRQGFAENPSGRIAAPDILVSLSPDILLH